MNFTLKDWLAAENSLRLYTRHPVLYAMYLAWLIFQSVLALLLYLSVIVFLVFFAVTSSSISVGIFVILCVVTSLMGYFSDMLKDPCTGLFRLDPKKYSRVYEAVNEISRNIQGPKIHVIFISNEFNAAATSFRSLTPFRQNILILGFPLLCAFSKKGLSGCLAHEIGHLKRNHISGATIFMMIYTFWTNIHLGLLTFLFLPWLRYWLPAFHHSVRPLFRKCEIEADKYIIHSLGGEYLAASQVEMTLKASLLSDVSARLFQEMRKEEWPQFNCVHFLRDELRKNLSSEKTDKILDRAMKTVDNVMDEHPNFADRLKLAGCVSPKAYACFEADALESFLPLDDALCSELNLWFHSHLDPVSETLRLQTQAALKWLENHPLSPDMDKDMIAEAVTQLSLSGQTEACKTFLEDCLAVNPMNPQLRALKAIQMAPDDPEQARIILEECIAQSPVLCMLEDNNFLIQYYIEKGDSDKLKAYLELCEGRIESVQKIVHRKLSENDVLAPHALEENLQQILCDTLKSHYKVIRRAYSVKRPVDDNTTYYVYFIVLEYKPRPFTFSLKTTQDILRELTIEGHTIVVKKKSFCENYLEPIPGARFYHRDTYRKS
ncbi:MAG: M48 family metallopeptidase [Planctomycetia bacterium]|nr:M48 family metallopeptidase [Planctomycetia bacterium]